MAYYVSTSGNSSTTSTQYYSFNYNYGYTSYNTSNWKQQKSKQEYKNKEVKYLLDKERGW